MGNAADFLRQDYAIRGGKIDPWGTIRVLSKQVKEPRRHEWERAKSLGSMPGLLMWSDKLVKYGKGGHRARVASRIVEIVAEDGRVVEEIPHTDFLVVDIWESYVKDDGHLEYVIGRDDECSKGFSKRITHAINQAAKGERPDFLDNSPFVQIDKKFAGQEVIELKWMTFEGGLTDHAMVFTKEGERIPCKLHYPLSYAVWEPKSEFAQYGRTEVLFN